MTKEITTKIVINALPEQVWAVLTNFKNYPNWNPFITSIQGKVNIGSKITVRMEPHQGKGMTFKPTILALDADKEFRWIGHLLFPGLFDGEHKFEIINNGNGTSTLIQSEKFKGILVPLFKKMLDTNTVRGFEAMNVQLKQQVEQNQG